MLKKLTIVLALLGLLILPTTAWAAGGRTPAVGVVPASILSSLIDRLEVTLPFSEETKAMAHVRLAQSKLAAAESSQGRAEAKKLMREYRQQMKLARKLARRAGKDTAARVESATSKHTAVLERVLAKVPDQAKDAIRHALEVSRRGAEKSARAVGKSRRHGEAGPGKALGRQKEKGKPPWAGQGRGKGGGRGGGPEAE